jgi:hypothetical protein
MSTEPDAIEPGAMMEPDAVMLSIDYDGCPEHLRSRMRCWIENGVIPGGFLSAVLQNDLAAAVAQADADSIAGTLLLMQFLHCRAPSGAHGSPAKFNGWADKRGLTGIMRGGDDKAKNSGQGD